MNQRIVSWSVTSSQEPRKYQPSGGIMVDQNLESHIAYFQKERLSAMKEAERQLKIARDAQEKIIDLRLELEMMKIPIPDTDDWSHIPMMRLGQIKKQLDLVWCPECRGQGKIVRKTPGILGFEKRERVVCPKCKGRLTVPARKIMDSELSLLSFYDRNLVNSVRQWPGERGPL